jgi:uncharacterized protein YggE
MAVLLLVAPAPASAQSNAPAEPVVVVSGDGLVKAVPDQA